MAESQKGQITPYFRKHYLTGQEHLFMGSTPEEEYREPSKVYMPPDVDLEIPESIEEINSQRTLVELYLMDDRMAGVLGFPNKLLAISLEPLVLSGPNAGQTIRDPRFLGEWDLVSKVVKRIENLDSIIKQYFRRMEATNSDNRYFLRDN